jgi:uncharacterized protein (TIGR02246 family)
MTERMKNIDVAHIYALWDAYAKAVNAADIERWMALWDEEGIRMAPNSPASVGTEQIRADIEPLFALVDFELVNIAPDEVQVLGDRAYSHGTYTFLMKSKKGDNLVEDSGKFLTILKKQADGSWKIIVDCFNADLPRHETKQSHSLLYT